MTNTELTQAREAEHQAEKATTTSTLAAYWAGSATASIARDYRAGRFTLIKAGR